MQLRPGLGRFCVFNQNMPNCWTSYYFGGKRETEGKRILRVVYGSMEIINFHLDDIVGSLGEAVGSVLCLSSPAD